MFANTAANTNTNANANDLNEVSNNADAWNSFHILEDVVDVNSMYLLSSLSGKKLTENFLELFEFEYENPPPTPRPCVMTNILPRIPHIPHVPHIPHIPCIPRIPRSSPVSYQCAVKATRPARTFAARVAAAGTALRSIAEGVHFVLGDVSATFIIPRKAADGSDVEIDQDEDFKMTFLGVQDMDWEPTPEFDDSAMSFDANMNSDEDGTVSPVVLLPVKVRTSSSCQVTQEPIQLRRSARLAAKVPLLGSVFLNGRRRSARLLKTVG